MEERGHSRSKYRWEGPGLQVPTRVAGCAPGRGRRRSQRALSARTRPAGQPRPRHAAQSSPAAPRPRQRTNSGPVGAAGAGNPSGRVRAGGADKGARPTRRPAPPPLQAPHRPGRGRGPSAGRHPSPPVATCTPRAQQEGRRVSPRSAAGTDCVGRAPGASPAPRSSGGGGCCLGPGPDPSPSPRPPARTHRAGAPRPARSAGDRG